MIKGLTIFDKYSQPENHVTKALIHLLMHSDVHLTKLFIKEFLNIEQLDLSSAIVKSYDLQIGSKLEEKSGIGYIVGITDEKKNNEEERGVGIEKEFSVPDAMIRLNNVTLLVESKIGSSKIDLQQMKEHEKKFADGENVQQEYIYQSWQNIYEFYKGIKEVEFDNFDIKTQFLFDEFLVFFENMGLTEYKSEQYIYTSFANRPKVLATIKAIHDYLKKKDEVHFNDKIKDCFGYMIKKDNGMLTRKFFSSSRHNKGTYILHLVDTNLVQIIQNEVNKEFQGNAASIDNRTPSEVHIHMNLVDNFEEIKPYIDIAYNDRLASIKK